MGLIPTPAVINKRFRLRSHLTEFFKDWHSRMPSTFQTILRDITMDDYTEFESWDADMIPNWIEAMVDILPDESYILKYPHFYLPITTDKPKVILLENLEIQSFLGLSWPEAFYGFYDNGTNMIVMNMSLCLNNPIEGLITIIHEYAHKRSMDEGVLPDGPVWVGDLIFSSFYPSEIDYTDWFIGDKSNFEIRLMAYGMERDIANIGAYSTYSQKVAEVFVRMKANVAVNNKYHNLEDLFDKGKVDTLFTTLFQEYAKQFVWPGKKQLIMEKNK